MLGTGVIIPGQVERMIREAVASQAELVFSQAGESQDFTCRLLDAYVHDGRPLLAVTRPIVAGEDVLLAEGEALDGRLVLGLRLFRFDTGVVVSSATYMRDGGGTPMPVTLVGYPTRLDELQRRRYHRCPMEVRLVERVEFVYDGVLVNRRGSAVTQVRDAVNRSIIVHDVGAGGLAFELANDFPHLLSPGERARIDLRVRTGEQLQRLTATIRVRHRVKLETGVRYGASFDGDEPEIEQARSGALKLVFAMQEATKEQA
ncbi:MAG: hypothetical protein CMH55_00940 [Myxococcales bacterium]|nr:hypothetical protein [Myxococcales bacterium]